MIQARTFLLPLLGTLALLALVGRADEGPIIIAHRDEHPFLTLDPFKGSLGVNGIYEADRSQSPGGSASATETLITQELGLSTGGTVVSGNILKWSAGGSISAEEDWVNVGGVRQSSTGYFDAYDVNADILGGTQFPISAYANRSEGFVTRTFAGMLRNTNSGYGANFQYRSPVLPSTLSLSHTTTTQSDLAGLEQFAIDQNNLSFGTSFQPGERQNVSLNYAYSTAAQNNPGSPANSTTLQSVALNHNWSLDPLGHYTLTQTFNYSQQEGTFNETRLRLGEQLRLTLAENLDGGLTYALERQEYPTSQTTTQFLNANLTHRLFESLTTTGRAGLSLTDSSFSGTGATSSTTNNYFASIGTSYRKKAFLGQLGANLSLGVSESQSGAVGATQQVLGDVQTFNDPQPIILTRTGVNPASIAVFDAAGVRRFVQGVDYTVRAVNNTVQIQRLLGSNIAAGDTVRLNYDINPLPGYTSQSLSLGAGATYGFDEGWLKGLNLFVRYYQVDQSISPASSGILPDSIRDTTAGAEYRVWKLTLRAEDERRDSTLAPYDSLRFSAGYADSLGEHTSLSINAAESYIRVPTDRSTTSSMTLDARLQYEIARNLRSVLAVQWRNDSYSNAPSATGIEEQAELRWSIRQTDVYLILRHASLDAQGNNTDTTSLQVGLSRSF